MSKKVFFSVVLVLVLVTSSLFVSIQSVRADGITYPSITNIAPAHPAPGQQATIYGSDFLTAESCNASDLQVWFTSPQGGVNWVSALAPGVEWDQNTIQLKIPANLLSGVTYKVTVIRCGYASVSTPYELTLGFRFFLPVVFR